LHSVEFVRSPAGSLEVVLAGEVRLPSEQMKSLVGQMSAR
jgi:hypothetical protein